MLLSPFGCRTRKHLASAWDGTARAGFILLKVLSFEDGFTSYKALNPLYIRLGKLWLLGFPVNPKYGLKYDVTVCPIDRGDSAREPLFVKSRPVPALLSLPQSNT